MDIAQNKDTPMITFEESSMPELEKALTRPPNPPVILPNRKVPQKRPMQRKRAPNVKRQKKATFIGTSTASGEDSVNLQSTSSVEKTASSQSENALKLPTSNVSTGTYPGPNPLGRPPGTSMAGKTVPIAKKAQSSVRKTQPGKVSQGSRLLHTSSPANSHRSSSLYNSPMTDVIAADPYVLSDYICKKSGLSKPVKQSVLTEHTYSKPHNWLPEHTLMRPVRYLFTEKPSDIKKQLQLEASQSEEMIDIELVDGDISMPGEEAWRSSAGWRSDDGKPHTEADDDSNWEDKISREGWSSSQVRLFNCVTATLDALELRALVCAGTSGEGTTMRTAYDMHANDLRYHLINCNHDLRVPIWLHMLLVERLPTQLKFHYKQLLARVKKAIPGIVDAMLKTTAPLSSVGRVSSGANIELPPLQPDPVAEQLVTEKFKRLPHSPVFLVVPDDHRMHRQPRFNLFTTMLHQMGVTFTVPLSQAPDGSSVSAGMELKTSETRRHLSDLRGRAGAGRSVCVVGFGTGAAVAMLAALAEPAVAALVCLGLPAATLEGPRGRPEDAALNVRAPTLFIAGEHDVTSSVVILESMRSRMSVYTQLVVIGAADDRLIVPRQKLISMGLTQAMVDKAILVEIHNFIGGLLTNPGSASMPPKMQAAKRPSEEPKTTTRRYIKKQNKNNTGGATPKVLACATTAPLSADQRESVSPTDAVPEPCVRRKPRPSAQADSVVPGLWQSKYNSPMLSPLPDKTRRNMSTPPSPTAVPGPAPSPQFATPTAVLGSAPSPQFVTPTAVPVSAPSAQFATPTAPLPSTTASPTPLVASPLPPGCYPIDPTSKLLKVLTSRPRAAAPPPTKVVLIGGADSPLNVTSKMVKINSQKFAPLTADNILNLPIIFAKDDDNIFQLKEEADVKIPTMDREKIVNKFEFSKPQPGPKYRKVVLSRGNQRAEDAGTSVAAAPKVLGSLKHVRAAGRRKNISIEHKEHDYE